MKPDFSEVKTLAAAKRLAAKGVLVKILYFPAEVGGGTNPENIGYVTPEAAQAKAMIDGTIVRFSREHLIDNLTITPDYKGDSFVPSRIVIDATHSKKKGGLHMAVEVW